ncbi:hypothetical protein [Archaeoglobus sp.]
MNDVEEVERRVAEIIRRRRKRNLIGATLVSTSIVLMEVAIMILLGIIVVNPIIAVIMIVIAPMFMAIGLYMLLTQPPIVLE